MTADIFRILPKGASEASPKPASASNGTGEAGGTGGRAVPASGDAPARPAAASPPLRHFRPPPDPPAPFQRLERLEEIWPPRYPVVPRSVDAFCVIDGALVWQRLDEAEAAFKDRLARVAKACSIAGEIRI